MIKKMENEKELRVVEAAKTVFLRYGFRRVTMQDIADEAGISRPSLYLIYPNKEEVFKATIRNLIRENLSTIREELSAQSTPEAKLQVAFEIWTVQPFQIMLNSPDAGDLVDCAHGFAREIVDQASAELETMLAGILMPLIEPSAGLTAEDIAHLLVASTHGFKESTRTVEELRRIIHKLIQLTLGALRAPTVLQSGYSPDGGAAPAPPTA